jgi:FlaA1/EpsC-like NDP-sugar epimerase
MVKHRRLLIVSFHLLLVVLANYLAFWLRFDGAIPERYFTLWYQALPWLVLIRGLTFYPFHLYQGLWRYASLWDLRNIILGALTSSLIFTVFVYLSFGLGRYPRSVFAIDVVLLICFMGGSRLLRRLYRDLGLPEHRQKRRVLIYGAGDAGEMIVRDMKYNGTYAYKPVGFVDDDSAKVGQRIHGIPVLGTRHALARIMSTTQPHEVLVAIPSAAPATLRAVAKALEPFSVPIMTLPNLRDILNGKVALHQIRTLAVEDLLPRAPVGLNMEPVRGLVTGQRVLVTGAGGSVGAELCRQVAALQPHTLLLLDHYEHGLFTLSHDLSRQNGTLNVQCLIGDVTDAQRVHAVMTAYEPQLVFHAAAHKHVPLMEANPCEAVKNNVFGTRIVAEAAAKHGAERFILISTDKAVNPSSVMGATKRLAELLIQDLSRRSTTRFLAVRFGNVLGSNGSVVPRFLEQIEAGGPVTVTHPEVQRYFMLIPEAVSLVLHAATLGQRGVVYVLDMGEQIKVLDMARHLIHLSGFVPDEEIPIVFTGLRPGEKLYEELVGMDETIEPSEVPQIFKVRGGELPEAEVLVQYLAVLEQLAIQSDIRAVLKHLCEMIPTFRPQYGVSEER